MLLMSKQGIHSKETALQELTKLKNDFENVQKKRESYLQAK